MDYCLSNMFALQESDDFQIPSSFDTITSNNLQKESILGEEGSVVESASKRRTRRGRAASLAMVGVGVGDDAGRSQKVMIHREIERQRREEMAKLYASLRSLLPLEFIKGKRSISDHMQQAVSYIKFKQENIEKMSSKLKRISNPTSAHGNTSLIMGGSRSSSSSSSSVKYGGTCNSNTVVVVGSWCQGGLVEISINAGIHVPLSRVLTALLQQGLCVVSCISTTVNHRLLHTLQSQVSNQACINLSTLQQKLTDVVNFQSGFH